MFFLYKIPILYSLLYLTVIGNLCYSMKSMKEEENSMELRVLQYFSEILLVKLYNYKKNKKADRKKFHKE